MTCSQYHATFLASIDAVDGSKCTSTTLTEAEREPSRATEYGRVRDMFYRFVREDSVQSFELDKVVVLDNIELESRFQKFFEQCVERFMAFTDAPTAVGVLNEEPLRKEWRRWVASHFEAYQERVSGNNLVNMVRFLLTCL